MSTIKCQNCGNEIESFKMILHERLCSINVRKCSICEEPVQIDEYKEHKEVSHPDIKCAFCGQIFKNSEYSSHEKNCSKKLFECKYCGLYMKDNELKDHEYNCGSKTIVCEFCKKTVTKIEYDLHLEFTCEVKLKLDKKINKINNENKTNNFSDSPKNQKGDNILKDLISGNKNNKEVNKVELKKKRNRQAISSENKNRRIEKNSSIKKKKK